MTKIEKVQVKDLQERMDDLETHSSEMQGKLNRMLIVLEDDQYSSNKGLITEVNYLSKQVRNLVYVNTFLKRFFWSFVAVAGSFLTMVINHTFFNE